MNRLALPLLLLSLGLGCGLPEPEGAPPFPQTAFLDLAKLQAFPDPSGYLSRTGDGRFLVLATPDRVGLIPTDVATGDAAWFPVGDNDRGRIVPAGDRLLQVIDGVGVAVLDVAADGSAVTELHRTEIPAAYLSVTDAFITLSRDGELWSFDRSAFLAGPVTADDAVHHFVVPIAAYQAGQATTDGEIVWIGQSDGATAWDPADPSAPLYRVGDWFGPRIGLFDDRLLVQTGYDSALIDVADPRAPALVTHVYGGQDFDVFGDYVYTTDRTTLYISDRVTGEPVRSIAIDPECGDVEVTPDHVYVVCATALHILGPNTP